MTRIRSYSLVFLLAGLAFAGCSGPQGSEEPEDAYLWLEEVEGERAMAWVEARNQETVDALSQHPVYAPIYQGALEVLNSDDRIAYPSIMGEYLYNFWTDGDHERGIWRRTSWASYLSGAPEWEVLLDIDALAEAEGVTWSYGGSSCLPPEYDRCLVRLSRGGADATEVREFDMTTASFVDGGFFLPEAKNSVTWRDENSVLVSTDFGEGTLTTSGYPRMARLWQRGQPLEEAETLYEIPVEDMGVWVGSIETADARFQIVSHRPSFFEGTTHVLEGDSLVQLDIPLDADPMMVADQIVVYVRSDWEVGGETYPQGSVVAMAYEAFRAGERTFDVVVSPTESQTVRGVSDTRDYLLVSMLDNVRSQLWRYRPVEGEWVGERIDVPELGTAGFRSTDVHTNRFFFTYSSFDQPTTLYLAEEDGTVRQVRQLPEMFDATGLHVEQHTATSADGTEVPFFIVHGEDMPHDGSNATLLHGYGGFEISQTPSYSALVGKAWLERGNVYVVANIRGGGEFGPRWHRAALQENRQRAYDDFLAVAEYLIEHGVTTADRLGISGGSNGGLLVGVAMTQRPDLFDAVLVRVPLLDMRRYNRLLAGASWMAEYGNPDVPEEWEYIKEYSPYQNVDADVDYPRPFFTTTTRDDRVHPGHARKMAAKMMDMGHPIRYFENTEGGHGSGVTPEQRARMYALQYTYLVEQLEE